MRVMVLVKATNDSEAGVIEIRPVYEMADFGEALTPEVAELHDRTREKAGTR